MLSNEEIFVGKEINTMTMIHIKNSNRARFLDYWKFAAKLVGSEYFEGDIERDSDWLEIEPRISKIGEELPYMPRSNAVFIAVMCGFSHPQKGQDFLLRLLPTAAMGDYLPLLDFEQRSVLSQLFTYFTGRDDAEAGRGSGDHGRYEGDFPEGFETGPSEGRD